MRVAILFTCIYLDYDTADIFCGNICKVVCGLAFSYMYDCLTKQSTNTTITFKLN